MDALELLGDVLTDGDDSAAGLSAYDEALRLTRVQRAHLLCVKAAALSDALFVDAARILDGIRASDLSRSDRIMYWLVCLDLGKTGYDLPWLKRVIRRVWQRDRGDELVKIEIEFCLRLIRFIEQEYDRRRAGIYGGGGETDKGPSRDDKREKR